MNTIPPLQRVIQSSTDDVLMLISIDVEQSRRFRAWDPRNARFTAGALRYIALVPLVLVAFICTGQVIRSQLKGKTVRPQWLQNIIEKSPDPLKPPSSHRSSPFYIAFATQLICFSVIGGVSHILNLILHRHFVQDSALLVTWLALGLFVVVKRPRLSSSWLLIGYLSILIVNSIRWSSHGYDPRPSAIPSVFSALAAIFAAITLLNMPMYDPKKSTEAISTPFSIPTRSLRSPEDNLTLWQFLTVSWMAPLISTAYARQLHEEDVWLLSYQFLHRPLHEKFKNLSGSLLVRLLKANGLDIAITSLTGLIALSCMLVGPLIFQQLLRSMQDPSVSWIVTVKYAAMTLAARLTYAQTSQLQMWFSRRAYERSRGEMITTLYQKTLSRKISLVGTGEIIDNPEEMAKRLAASKGKIFNLMRGDCYNVAQRFWEIPPLLQKPIGFILSIYLIWNFIGWPCLLGMLTVLTAQGVNALIIRYLYTLEQRRRAITDAKLQRTSSLVEAIRHLRWYGWQNTWLADILEARRRELNMRLLTGFLGVIIGFTNQTSSIMFTVVAFFAYTKLAHLRLTVDIAFPALQLFAMLQDNLREIPNLVTVLLNASVAIDRLNEFMNEEDKPIDKAPSSEKLRFENASFSWPGTSHDVLRNLDMSFSDGLTLITGKVGSGKTALLNAVLGELDLDDGRIVCPEGSIAYCAQVPWLESKSIRENILFALPYNEARYRQVIYSCALTPDLEAFKNGDRTKIGENGIGLSGGQKARVALARAIYSDARIVLLDDPLAALDRPTSSHIIKYCIGGSLLEHRTVLFVTHQPETFEGLAYQTVNLTAGEAALTQQEVLTRRDSLAATQTNGHVPETKVNNVEGNEPAAEEFLEKEHRVHGGVRFSVYWRYIKAGKLYWWALLIVLMVLLRLASLLDIWFLKEWGEAYQTQDTGSGKTPLGFLRELPSPDENVSPWLLVFFIISASEAFLAFTTDFSLLVITYVAAKNMFRKVLERFCSSTFRYLDVTPVGRIMNRLVGDIDTLDGNISGQLRTLTELGIRWISCILVIASVTPAFLVFAVCLMIAFVAVFVRFLPTSQSLRRLEMVSLTPLMSDFGALLDGLLTVRAFGVQQRFQDRLLGVVDNFQSMDHFYWSLQTWMQYRFDIIVAISGFILVLLAVFTNVSPGLTAFALITSNQLMYATHQLCKNYGQLQMDFVAVERVVELLDLEQEDPGNVDPPAGWPSQTHGISFEKVTLHYARHLPPALSNVSFNIQPGANVALIGRTGCGKTTLALSLLSTLTPETGSITIDGLDISKIDKQALRSRVTFLAQEPVLFPGTIRENLDPTSEYSDTECTGVLDRIGGNKFEWTLGTHIESRGANLSLGQRQLVSLARALLRRSSVIIMDEATASIDTETETMVHNLIKNELASSIILTIAHRVEAIRGADWVIVLDKGQVVRQGTPAEILNDDETAKRLDAKDS